MAFSHWPGPARRSYFLPTFGSPTWRISLMNSVWDSWVSPGNTPARATVEAKLASPDYKVEIMVVAAR
jgi:enamine deaminase RidA (YjgF/YER057c/UK114 family)